MTREVPELTEEEREKARIAGQRIGALVFGIVVALIASGGDITEGMFSSRSTGGNLLQVLLMFPGIAFLAIFRIPWPFLIHIVDALFYGGVLYGAMRMWSTRHE